MWSDFFQLHTNQDVKNKIKKIKKGMSANPGSNFGI